MTVEIVPFENVTKINKKLKFQFVTKINKNYGIIRMEFYPLCLICFVSFFFLRVFLFPAGVKPDGHSESHDVIDMRWCRKKVLFDTLQ